MEEKFRMKIFMENKARIARHNQKAHRGEKTYFLKMNHFGDQVQKSYFENNPNIRTQYCKAYFGVIYAKP